MSENICIYKARFLAKFKKDIIAYKKNEKTWLNMSFIGVTEAFNWMKDVNNNENAEYEVLEIIIDTMPHKRLDTVSNM